MKNSTSWHQRHFVPAIAGATLAAIFGLLASCSSAPATHYHTLLPPPSASDQVGIMARLEWNIHSVVIPAQVDQPQWVVRVDDGSLVVLENERWIAPLGDEIRGAVTERLTRSFGPPQVAPSASGDPGWRIGITVQRFDLIPNQEARLETDWTLRGKGAAVSCHTSVSQPVSGQSYVSLARAQQQAVAQLADVIGAALHAASKGQASAC